MTMCNMKRVHFFRERDKLIIVETGFVSNYGGMLFHHQENQKRVKIKSIEDTKKYHLYYHHHRDHKDLSNHGHLPVGRPYQNTLEQKGSHFWQKQEIPFCARERTELMEPSNKRWETKNQQTHEMLTLDHSLLFNIFVLAPCQTKYFITARNN